MFGPAGLRTFVRSILKMTKTRTAHRYVVHELLAENDETTPCDPPDVLHSSENVGRDIQADGEGFWRIITTAGTRWASPLAVDAGPIEHRGATALLCPFRPAMGEAYKCARSTRPVHRIRRP
jgi:ribonuclease Z